MNIKTKTNLKKAVLLTALLAAAFLAGRGIAYIKYEKIDGRAIPASGSVSGANWGLGFGQEGSQPTGNATSEELQQYDAHYVGDSTEKVIYLTFDAGYENGNTQPILDALKKHNVPATFFVVGEWVDKYPESVKALHDAGHEVMNHSNTHAHYPQLSAGEVVADLNACNDKIEKITGVRPTLVRLPYGDYDDNSVNAVRSIGMEPIQWDVESSVI